MTRPYLPALAALTLALASTAYAQADLARQNYVKADTDGDGVLVYAEFVTFVDLNAAAGLAQAARISQRGLHARAFDRIDANGDGAVTPAEFQALR